MLWINELEENLLLVLIVQSAMIARHAAFWREPWGAVRKAAGLAKASAPCRSVDPKRAWRPTSTSTYAETARQGKGQGRKASSSPSAKCVAPPPPQWRSTRSS